MTDRPFVQAARAQTMLRKAPATMFLRYQDKDGRGPFRPGIPALWADTSGSSPPTVFQRFPTLAGVLPILHDKGLVVGCGCIGWDGLDRYFTSKEQERLHDLGYRVHRIPRNSVFLWDDDEVVFSLNRPIKTLPRAKRP